MDNPFDVLNSLFNLLLMRRTEIEIIFIKLLKFLSLLINNLQMARHKKHRGSKQTKRNRDGSFSFKV